VNRAIANPDGTGSLTLGETTLEVVTDSLDEAMAELIGIARAHAAESGADLELVAHAGGGNDRTGLRITPSGEVIVDHRILAAALVRRPQLQTAKPKAGKAPKASRPPKARKPSKTPTTRVRSKRPVLVAGVGALLASAAIVVILTGNNDAAPSVAPRSSISPTSATQSVAPAVTLAPAPRTARATASAKPGEALRVEISSTRPPVAATVRVRTLAGKVLATREVKIAADGTGGVAIAGLKPGTYLWEVRVDDATPLAGRVVVPKAPPRPTPTYTPPATSTIPSTGSSTPGSSTATKPSSGGGGGGGGGPVGINDGGGATGPVGAN
jgi:hypothetical protein